LLQVGIGKHNLPADGAADVVQPAEALDRHSRRADPASGFRGVVKAVNVHAGTLAE
jgi:hypothetical protein